MKRILIIWGTAGLVAILWATDPSLGSVSPPGVQAGTEVEMRFDGSRLEDAQEILFYKSGFQVLKLEEVKGNFVRAKVKVAPDCPLGEHPVRVRTSGGVTDLRTFYVGPFPVVPRVVPKAGEPPQKLSLNCTLHGSVGGESQDLFTVDAKAGQRLSVEIESMRLGRGFADPYVEVLDTKGFILARADDTKLFIQDCFASATVPMDGTYTIKVRETSYGSLGLYRMHLGAFARPTAVYPGGGQVGQDLQLKWIDPGTGDFLQSVKLQPPANIFITDGRMEQPDYRDFGIFAARDGVRTPSWNRLRIAEFANALETEPNNAAAQATKVAGDLPLAFNGIIEKPGDVDWFRFQGKAGQTFDVHVFARKLRSPLDSVLVIGNKDGGALTSNDDSGGSDSYVRFTLPSTGEFTLSVTDHLGNGGPDFVYRVEFQPVLPRLTTYIPDVSRYDTQTRKSVVVARGNRFPLVLSVRRQDFGGPLQMSTKGFPTGITLHCDELAANKGTITMVFDAAPDAPIAGKLGDLQATLKGASPQPVTGGICQNFDLVQLGNNGVYYRTWVDQIAVAVTEELPYKIRIEPLKAPLVREGTLPVKIIAERQTGFTSGINVQMLIRPPGLNCPSSIDIPAGQTEAIYNFSADGGAEVQVHQIAMLGTTGVKGGTAYVSTQLTPLDIKEQFTLGDIPLATTTQGYPTEVKVNLTQKVDFPGTAKVELLGLPPGTKTTMLEMTKATKELTFPITTDLDARPGLHRTIFCQMTVNYNGAILTQTFGGRGSLRVDPPPPAPPLRKPILKGPSPIEAQKPAAK